MSSAAKTAVLHRMVMNKHICPFGLKALALLRREGFEVDDRWLTTREAVDAFKAEHNVKTTPQTFIGGARIGGYDDLRRHFGLKVKDPKALTYKPVIAVFGVAALMAAAADFVHAGAVTSHTVAAFIAFSMCLLALLKLRDVETFSNTFLGYDILARRWVPYSYIYPFAELAAGVLMIAGALTWFAAPPGALHRHHRRDLGDQGGLHR
jgi:glutaredoxin